MATNELSTSKSPSGNRRSVRRLMQLGFVSAILYGTLALLSRDFDYGTPGENRPLLLMLLVLATLFAVYIFSIKVAKGAGQTRRLVGIIVGWAIVFRIVLLFSLPIQEVDIYRYIWDGAVASQGISPFRFAPDQVKAAIKAPADESDLSQLAALCQNDPGLHETLERVHFGYLPTVYPRASQIVFMLAARTTPNGTSVQTRVRIMKACLLVFDLATLLLVIRMLSLCQLPVGMSVAYGWCPLLLKEIANSGHLDSIAVFFCTLSIYLFVLAINRAAESERRFFHPGLTGSAIALAAGVGAKLFPIVLLPLVILVGGKKCGWRAIVLPGIAFTTLTIALLWPMLPQSWKSGAIFRAAPFVKPATSAETDPGQGMTAFLKSWEINDLIFMIVIENLKPADQFPKNETVWFSVVPDERREQMSELTQAKFTTSPSETPFLIARFLTGVIFGLLAIWLAWRASHQTEPAAVGLAAFLTIAWFWLLSPTQNPWYWIWALPFLPFARNRAWYAVSGFVLLYYLRFWFRYHFSGVEVLNTPYMGTNFFDYVLPWIEFVPFLVWLAVEGWIRRKGSKESVLIASLQRPSIR